MTDHPALILLGRGRKIIRIGGRTITLFAGDAVAIAPGTTCDIQNETEGGRFTSTWIICADPILSDMARACPDHGKLKDVAALTNLGDEFVQSFERAAQAIITPDRTPDIVPATGCGKCWPGWHIRV